MNLSNIFEMLKQPLNLAHVEDRKSEKYLMQNDVDYQAAIQCHQRAHAHLRTVQLNIPAHDLHRASAANHALIESLYSQMERHLLQQSILLHRQKGVIIDLKRQPYVATMREKTTELALNDAIKHRDNLRRQLSQQDTLMERLKENIPQEDVLDLLVSENGSEKSRGKKKPKSTKETLEELENVNAQFKLLIDQLVEKNLRLTDELLASQMQVKLQDHAVSSQIGGENGDMAASQNSIDNPIYSLPKALELAPLEHPPDFEIPEEELLDCVNIDGGIN